MEGRFRKVAQRVQDWIEHRDPPAGDGAGDDSRFVMKPGEVQIIRGGGTPVDRAPGEPRGGAAGGGPR